MYFSSGTQLSAALAALSPSKVGQFLAFDALFYSNTYMLNGNTTGMTAIEHFVQFGAPAMAMPNPTFDPAFYKQSYADLAGTNFDAADLLYHFMQFGLDEGRVPNATLNATFDADAYLAAYPAVAAYVNANLADFGGSTSNGAIAHYVKFGMAQGFTLPEPAAAGTTFNLVEETAASADVMRLTGDQAARIDFTLNNNQVKALDLDGDGVIENNGVENNNPTALDDGLDFEIVDAYKRDLLNENNTAQNYLGNISYDGTGFAGDGVNTDGNIFLGGLGADIALGGIGNDFLAGGGVAQTNNGSDRLDGGRNADFFFAELSLLDNTDGNGLTVNGGSTSDDAAVGNNTPQDSDWLLLEASDDEDGTTVSLVNDELAVTTGAGQSMGGTEIENVDASGNLYGFLDDVDVAIGGDGKLVNGENVGIGASAQLNIIGSVANNILIGGYENDLIEGNDGNDLLMGGNLNYALNNVNAAGIVNNGMDELFGDVGDDNIVFEADGGIIDGGFDVAYGQDDDVEFDGGSDTLWLTRESLGIVAAADADTLIEDSVVRMDLENGDDDGDGDVDGIDNFATTLGANVDGTADQTNYLDEDMRVDVDGMESVIATGMGAIDYLAAGSNDPELSFNNQQNHFAYDGDLDIRGTSGVNTLYAAAGADVIEGREGGTLTTNALGVVTATGDNRDKLSGGDGRDDFIFALDVESGDGVDVIHRQHDIGNNITDGTFEQDFGLGSLGDEGDSFLTVDFTGSDLALVGVAVTTFDVTVDGVVVSGGAASVLSAFTTVSALAAHLDTVFGTADDTLSVSVSGNVITVAKAGGGVFGTDIASGTIIAGTATNGPLQTLVQTTNEADIVTPDRLIYKAYEDRSDDEGVNDDAGTGSSISLGQDSYAQDLVVSFSADGTRIAEDQSYDLTFDNLTTEDTVTVTVNGVTYSLQVGVSIDGTQEDDEDGVGDSQAEILDAFGGRFAEFINSFMDDDTASGSVDALWESDTDTLTLTQNTYDGEETVFMSTPTIVLGNQSGGEKASVVVVNNSQHEVHLLDYAGRNNDEERFSEDNVLFIGEEGVANNRAILATALVAGGTLTGSEALVINGGVDDLLDVAHNLATDNELHTDSDDDFNDDFNGIDDESNGNFVVHGDDYLIGGNGLDTINAGTGDDRVRGSKGGTATNMEQLDGGGDLYAVRELGSTKYVVETLNAYDAEQRNEEGNVLDMYLLEQTEEADEMITGDDFVPYFQDTLIYHQADFTASQTRFTINLNDYNVGTNEIILDNGGAGTVSTDEDGDGDFEDYAAFTNFENIRTVSGTGNAVANVSGLTSADGGQGRDTLIISGLSTDSDGVTYNLTNDGDAGLVSVGFDTDADDAIDLTQDVIFVDGVENVITGEGDDTLLIDETEAAKDNTFTAGDGSDGDDTIVYSNDYGDADFEPTVTVMVQTSSNTDLVRMTQGRVGQTVATDTLFSVETIALAGDTAQGIREDDTLDVTAVTTDVVVNYITGEVSTGSTLLVTVGNIYELENVLTDANDVMIVADADTMSLNGRSDEDGDQVELVLDTYLSYDSLNDDLERESVADMRANNEENNDIPEVLNFEQFTFNLGEFTDRVDYSNTDDQIVAAVNLDLANEVDYVFVNGNGGSSAADSFDEEGDRVDALINVEEIVASQGESVLDLTAAETNLNIRYSKVLDGTDRADIDSTETLITIENADTSVPYTNRAYVELYDNDTAGDTTGVTALWNRIEGSDADEYIELTADQGPAIHTFNLRGGDNEVNYNELQSTGIELSIQEIGTGDDGFTSVNVQSKDNAGVIQNVGDTDADGVVDGGETWTDYDRITSYNGLNETSVGALRIEASQSEDDSINLESVTDNNLIILGQTEGLDDIVSISLAGGNELVNLVLTGFEMMIDGSGDDTYTVEDLTNFLNTLTLTDNVAPDFDTLKLTDGALENYTGAGGDDDWSDASIELTDMEATIGFDFQALDITEVTEQIDYVVGTDETLVLGSLSNFGDLSDAFVEVQGFQTIEFTSTTGMGSDVVIDMDLGEFRQGDGTVLFQFNAATTFDFSAIADDMIVTVVDTFAVGVTVITDGEDIITGGAGDDTITGGAFADVLDGGIVPAVGQVETVTFNGGAATLEAGDDIHVGNTFVFAGFDVVVGADADQVGQFFADIVDATWEANLGLTAGDIASVDYDAVTNVLSFNYSVAAGNVGDIVTTDMIHVVTGTLVATDDGVTTPFAAQGESADTFVYLSGDSTETAMDSIFNFSVGAVDDKIDFTGMPDMDGHTVAVYNGGSGFADFAAVKAAAAASFIGDDSPYIGSDGTDTWIFIDDDHSASLDAGEGVIKLVGIDATGIDLNNFVAW